MDLSRTHCCGRDSKRAIVIFMGAVIHILSPTLTLGKTASNSPEPPGSGDAYECPLTRFSTAILKDYNWPGVV